MSLPTDQNLRKNVQDVQRCTNMYFLLKKRHSIGYVVLFNINLRTGSWIYLSCLPIMNTILIIIANDETPPSLVASEV